MATASGYTDSEHEAAKYVLTDSPAMIAAPATGVSASGAVLNAAANDMGAAATVWFIYGTSSTLNTRTEFVTIPAASGLQRFSVTLTGLSSKTKYYFQPVAKSAGGASYGIVSSFTTN
jgi:hypothetical protein